VAQDARAHRYRTVHILPFHKGGIAMTHQAQIRRRVRSQHELKIALMGIMAADTLAACNRLVDIVPRR